MQFWDDKKHHLLRRAFPFKIKKPVLDVLIMCSAKPSELDLRSSKAQGINAVLPGLCPSYQSTPI
jgi:hypothetical protein